MDFKWPKIDLVQALHEGGVLATFERLVRDLLERMPAGAQPTEGQINKLFGQAMASAPGVLRDRLNALPAAALKLATTGRGRVTKDPSALA